LEYMVDSFFVPSVLGIGFLLFILISFFRVFLVFSDCDSAIMLIISAVTLTPRTPMALAVSNWSGFPVNEAD